MSRNRCCECLRSELHYSKLCFYYKDWRAFAYTPWLPQQWRVQWVFVVYRCFLALYYLAWLIASLATYPGGLWFIFLTNWSLMMWIAYLFVAAASVTFKFLQINMCCKEKFEDERAVRYTDIPDLVDPPVRVGCCGMENDTTSWYQKLQWILHTVGTGSAFAVMLLYWSLLYRGETVDGINANTHLTNGLLALLDIWVSGTPIRLLHVVYFQLYCAIYSVFTGIYFAASDGDYVYSLLDYDEQPVTGAVIIVVVTLIFVAIVHLVLYSQYALRHWCVRRARRWWSSPSEEPSTDIALE